MVSAVYCISFIFGVNFIVLNLVIAVIIDQFVESAGREGLFLDNTLFEILHKKMLLDRFLKRLRTKVSACSLLGCTLCCNLHTTRAEFDAAWAE